MKHSKTVFYFCFIVDATAALGRCLTPPQVA